MRYPASEKLEIIRLVEGSHLSARLTRAKLGIPRTIFYRWYDRYLQRGEAGLQDQSPKPKHVWNRIPDEVRHKVIKLALKETELSPRELAVTFTDQESYFVSEASTYRILKAHDLITSPAFIVIKAANEFKDKTTCQSALADRLHLSEDHRLGVVLSQHDPRRLQPLHHRVSQHILRMCIGFFTAAGSAFNGPGQNVFPDVIRESGILSVPKPLIFVLMVFWLVRTLFWNARTPLS